jgi:diaminohydroxyphosphoribosylaminopyrimidine deaminase / 5-amino-6-(5-phosphoribosylamino)uracil reductase
MSLERALELAERGRGTTHPNPVVGAVVARDGEVVGEGWHERKGGPHAEVVALEAAGERARGATLYVTLEPCSTHGRTPPCTDAIMRAGFARVVVGAVDPNPAHAGRGIGILQKTGIEVTTGVLEEYCRELNAAFNKWIVTKMPLVIAKTGMSLDGRITRLPDEGQWLTSEAARADAQKLRAQVDAILIGGETLRADNPRLTVRGIPGAKQPWRAIISRSGNLLPDAHVFTDEHRDRTLVYTGKTLRAVLRDLGQREITSVLIEGGMRVLGEAFDRRLVDRVQFYIAPLLVGGPKVCIGGRGAGSTAESAQIINPCYTRIGDDLRLSGEVVFPAPV